MRTQKQTERKPRNMFGALWSHRHDPVDIVWRLGTIFMEYVRVVRETAQMGKKIKHRMLGVLAFNVSVNIMELVLIGATTFMMNTISEHREIQVVELMALAIIVYYFLRVIKDNPLEFVRDWYAERYFRRRMFIDLTMKGSHVIAQHDRQKSGKDILPQLLRGRESWMVLVDLPLREFATIILVLPAFAQLHASAGTEIALIAFLSVPLGIVATMAKDFYLKPVYKERQKAEYALLTHEADGVRHVCHVQSKEYVAFANHYAESHMSARIQSSMWDNIARDGVYNIMLAVALYLGYLQLVAGRIEVGDFTAIIMLCDFARRPVQAIFSMQAEMQVRREAMEEYYQLLLDGLHPKKEGVP